jgi:hypothetical protein
MQASWHLERILMAIDSSPRKEMLNPSLGRLCTENECLYFFQSSQRLSTLSGSSFIILIRTSQSTVLSLSIFSQCSPTLRFLVDTLQLYCASRSFGLHIAELDSLHAWINPASSPSRLRRWSSLSSCAKMEQRDEADCEEPTLV